MSNAGKIKVLCVDDDAVDQRLIVKLLTGREQPVSVHCVESLTEAKKRLDQNEYDIILLDLSLPESFGLASFTEMREYTGDLPIVILTSLDDPVLEKELLAAGVQDYLIKGEFTANSLMREISHAIYRQTMKNEVDKLLFKHRKSQIRLEQQATLLQKKNRKLHRLYRTAQKFVDNVSHDFRTPLTVIKDYLAIMREGMAGPTTDEQNRMLDKVSVRADDLNHMVDDLLDISKMSSGLLGAWRRHSQVSDMIRHAESMLRQRAAVRGIRLLVECESEIPAVYCDSDLIVRVITNLAVNAIKFSKEGSDIKIWAQADPVGHQVIVGVTDHGPGIDEESLKLIFERFRQIDGHTKTNGKGYGLGLNIANELCRINLGELSVVSRVGEGSTFSFTIPYIEPVEVLTRWLKVCASRRTCLQLATVSVEPCNVVRVEDFDRFLNCYLRKTDLLFRTTPNTWLLVMATSTCESGRWQERIEEEFKRHNRNRPMGPLPEFTAALAGEWKGALDHEAIITTVRELVQRACASVEISHPSHSTQLQSASPSVFA